MRDFSHAAFRWLIAVCLVAIGVVGYVDAVLLDEDAFAERLAAALDDEDVQRGLATQAVDLAFDQLDADALLAESLPEEVRLAATPLLELSKPAVARAGAELLGVDAVTGAIETAARSVHRQTTTAILAAEETQVTINTRPVLVVTADAIIGPAGARAAVAVDLPPEATSIDLGSNQNVVFSAIRLLGFVAFAAVAVLLIAVIGYFISARHGARLAATRRLGRTMVTAGAVVAAIGVIAIVIVGVAIEIAFSTDQIAFGTLSIGGSGTETGTALASVLLDPIIAAGRRTIIAGAMIIGLAQLFSPSRIAEALRTAIRTQDPTSIVQALRVWVPAHLLWSRWVVNATLALTLLVWSRPTLRVILTLTGLALVAHLALSVAFAARRPWSAVRTFVGGEQLSAVDATDRTPKALALRRTIGWIAVPVAVLWPSYDGANLIGLVWVVAAAFGATYFWEDRPNRVAEAEASVEASMASDAAWSWPRRLVVAGTAVLAAVMVLVPGNDEAIRSASATSFTATAPTTCNGHAELCDRTLDAVTFAGTHNSMSAAELGWEIANHERAIPAQLDAGIRALLIDVQRWEVDVNLSELDFDPAAAEIASAALAGADVPADGLWMCHQLCQLGATPFEDFLADIRVFLETNVDEVLVIVIQDDAPAADIKAAIESADLVRNAFAHQPGTAWPTLREMIAADQRLVFMAENVADADGWYQSVYGGNVTETGYEYALVEDFDCTANRGEPDSPLFLINHWVETGLPIPAEADEVNSTAVLQSRIDQCRTDRGRSPSIIAVNFWERGDLLAVVDELNGVAS